CSIYSLGRVIKGISGMNVDTGNYTLDRNWNKLITYQESQFESGQVIATPKGLHFYKANLIGNSKRHFALMDIRGEQFEEIDDWNREIIDFFLTYLSHCKGMFLFLDLDADAVARSRGEVYERYEREFGRSLTNYEKNQLKDAYEFKRKQMSHMVSFLSVAATIPKMLTLEHFEEKRNVMSQAARDEEVGSRQVNIPVALCISKADLIKDRRFDGFPAIVPGSDSYLGDPWNAVETFFKNDLDNMKKLAPNLKVEWVSSTGDNFNPERGIGIPMGVSSVFNHVVAKPAPRWAMSSRAYARWRRFLRV
ncbi:MAG: hypothetical protein QNK37_15575, partial [Acidobacteriota bacterium]|nr:hypothetical protein [Acidobacteriota bacterium]